MSKLDVLLEQTAFLLEKQKEAKTECEKIFSDLLSFIDKESEKTAPDSPESESLKNVYDMLSGQVEKISMEAQEEIDFLTEQLGALTQISQVKDPIKAQSLLDMIFDKDTELEDTETFKENLMKEATFSKQNLLNTISDIQGALSEGNFSEVEMYLETITLEEDEENGKERMHSRSEDDDDVEFEDEEEEFEYIIEGEESGCKCKPEEKCKCASTCCPKKKDDDCCGGGCNGKKGCC